MSLAFAGLFLAGCEVAPDEADLTPTAWPTLEPFTQAEEGMPTIAPTIVSGPQLLAQYRVDLEPDLMAIFPIEGTLETPVRVEVVILSGNPDPMLAIRNGSGDTLVHADEGEAGQPEVIGQFQFPGAGFYEIGVQTLTQAGEVGISIYSLPEADIQSGGSFTASNEELRGTMDHPATFHTFRLPLDRGVRVDIGAEALTEGLDLLYSLYDPDGLLVSIRDDNIDLNPYLWSYMPDKTGIYTLVLSNYDENTGDYLVRVTDSVTYGEMAFGSREEINVEGSPQKPAWYTFRGRALDAVYIEGRPLDVGMDLMITLYDQYGNVIMVVNDWGGLDEEVLTQVQLPFDGIYQVEFSTLGESGRVEYYARTIKQADIETGGPIIPGAYGQVGEVTGSGSVVTYLFEADAGDLIGVDIRVPYGSDLDLGFDLFGPDGTLLVTRDDVAGLLPLLDRFEITETGVYALCIWNKYGTEGEFDIYVTDPGSPSEY